MRVAKLTVRVSDEARDCLREFCSRNGVSLSAWMQALAEVLCSHEREMPVHEWTVDDPYRFAQNVTVERAREIDASHRSRKPSE